MSEQPELDTSGAVNAIGQPLLEFICARPLDDIQNYPPAIALVNEINTVLSTKITGGENVGGMGQYLKYRLSEPVDGEVVALTLHKQSGGAVVLPTTSDRLEELVGRLAVDCYPLALLPPDDFEIDMPGRMSSNLSSTLHRHPLAVEFRELVVKDKKLSKAFSVHSDSTGYSTAMIYRSTGHGSSVQLWSLLDIVFNGAWRSSSNGMSLTTMEEFSAAAVQRWRSIRSILTATGSYMATARLAFTGVRLPGDGSYKFEEHVLRQVGEQDREYVPQQLVGQLTGTDAAGNTVQIDYSGDVVADTPIPYVAKFVDKKDDEFPEFPQEIMQFDNLDRFSARLRASLLLAVTREHRVNIVPSWRSIDDPLEHYASRGWSDPRQATGLMPTQLTEDEVASWQKWFALLGMPGSERLEIALTRTVRAAAERRDPVDVLIDAVIAWENVFGSSQGELKLRITASMARLLASDPAERVKVQRKLSTIYNLRSRIVHGSGKPKASEFALCYEAIDYSLALIRAVFTERPDLLTNKEGTDRSMKLLLE